MRPQRGLRRESLPADVAVERAVLQPLDLGFVVAEMLLEVGELDEGAAAVEHVTLVRTLPLDIKKD